MLEKHGPINIARYLIFGCRNVNGDASYLAAFCHITTEYRLLYIQSMLYKYTASQEDRRRKMTEGNGHTTDPTSESGGEKDEERKGVY